jgi:hypothetical protein
VRYVFRQALETIAALGAGPTLSEIIVDHFDLCHVPTQRNGMLPKVVLSRR